MPDPDPAPSVATIPTHPTQETNDMTTTPLATIAEALIEFILSLLRDPRAAAEFEADPDRALARAGLADVCAADVRSVMPVVVERPEVVVKPYAVHVPVPKPAPAAPKPVAKDPEVVKHIQSVANNYHIDNRSTIVDQSVNQNIWAEGDVTQIFDQEAVLAVGDESIAVGEDALLDESQTDVTIGDVNIGNTDTDVTVSDSYNDSSTDVVAEVESDVDDSFNDSSTTTEVDVDVEDSFTQETTTQTQVETRVEDSFNDVEGDVDAYASTSTDVEVEALPEIEYENS